MFLLLLLHLVAGIGIVAAGKVLGRQAFLVAAVAPLATLLWASANASGVLDGVPVTESFAWIPQLGIDVDLRLDAFALLMVAVIAGIGLLICIYSMGYFGHDEPGLARLAGVLVAVRRSDARRRPVRPARRPVHLLGADLGHVVSPDRQRRHQSTRPGRVDAGHLHHRCRRTRPPRRPDHHRPGRRHLPDVRAARRPAERRRGQRRHHPRPRRCVHEVGAGAVQQLAPGGDGRPHPGERVPALGDDGQGRRLPRRPHGADVRHDGQLASRGDGDRRLDDGDRRAARAATVPTSSSCSPTGRSASSAS